MNTFQDNKISFKTDLFRLMKKKGENMMISSKGMMTLNDIIVEQLQKIMDIYMRHLPSKRKTIQTRDLQTCVSLLFGRDSEMFQFADKAGKAAVKAYYKSFD